MDLQPTLLIAEAVIGVVQEHDFWRIFCVFWRAKLPPPVVPDQLERVSTTRVRPLFRSMTAPLGQNGPTYQLKGISAGSRSFLIEILVGGRLDGGKFLQRSQAA